MTWSLEDRLLWDKARLNKINSRMVRRVSAQRDRIARLHAKVDELEKRLETTDRCAMVYFEIGCKELGFDVFDAQAKRRLVELEK